MENHRMSARRLTAVFALALLAVATLANAQTIYRIVGPDGKVTFSDRPPPDAGQGKAAVAPSMTIPARGGDSAAASAGGAPLPFELRGPASRYPVVIYTRPGCAPCDAGRNLLTSRGVPFTEKTVTSQEDIEALARLAGTPTLPLTTIGSQQLKGFSELEWTQFLDAAGYPKVSQLPRGYQRPAPTPLVAASRPAPQAQAQAEPEPEPPAQTPPPATSSGPSPSNPAGIQF
jgi:glutaredoxin